MRNVIYQFQSSNGQDKSVRQHGRQKIWPLFGKKNYCEFFSFTCYFISKKNYGSMSSGFPIVTLQSYKEILKKNRKGAITPEKNVFKNLRKPFLDIHTRNHIPKFQSSRLNGVAVIERTHIHTHIHTHTHTNTYVRT